MLKEPRPTEDANLLIKTQAPIEFILGNKLRELCELALQKKRRNAYSEMTNFLENPSLHNKLGVVYGLRNTGKTVILQQLAGHPDRVEKSVYLSLKYRQCAVWELEDPIRKLMDQGYQYFYIDEASWAESFIDLSMGLADLFTSAKIIISGTDSLSFRLAANDALYHRVVFARTTWMPFDEYKRIADDASVLSYIDNGGVFWEDVLAPDIGEYVETSIVNNIYNTLNNIDRNHISKEIMLELSKADLYKIVRGICEAITIKYLYGKIANNWGKPFAQGLQRALSDCGIKLSPQDFALGVVDAYPYDVETSKYDRLQVELVIQFLQKIDFLIDIEMCIAEGEETRSLEFTQPGIMRELCRNTIRGILKSGILGRADRERVTAKLSEHSEADCLEKIVLLALRKFFLKKDTVDVLKIRHIAGDFKFDAAVNVNGGSLSLIEVKRTDKLSIRDARYLKDPQAIKWVEGYFGKPPTNKTVLYRGETHRSEDDTEGVSFINIEDFLLDIGAYLEEI